MKAQRKDVKTDDTHITVRLKKGGAGKGQSRFEVLISRAAYPSGPRAKTHQWNMAEVVDTIFTNAAKLEAADKQLLDTTFPDRTQQQIILEILDRGEAQLSEHDRSEQTAHQSDYFAQVAAAVAASAVAYPEVGGGAGDDGAASSKAKKKKSGAAAAAEDASTTTAAAAAAGAGAGPRLARFEAEIMERELKNIKFKPLGAAATLDDDVNAAFVALVRKCDDFKVFRDQHIWVFHSEKQQDTQDALSALATYCGRKPWKIIKTVTTDKTTGAQQVTVLVDGSLGTKPSKFKFPAGCTVTSQDKTHVPTSDDDNLALSAPPIAAAPVKVASQPAAAAAAVAAAPAGAAPAAAEADKPAPKKAGGKASAQQKQEATKTKSLADDLAALAKHGASSSSDDDDDAPKMQVKKGKKK